LCIANRMNDKVIVYWFLINLPKHLPKLKHVGTVRQGKCKFVTGLDYVRSHEDVSCTQLWNTSRRRMCEWRWNTVEYHAFLTSTLDGGEWSASRSGRFTPGKRAPGTHWIGSRVDFRAGLYSVAKRKIPTPCRESNSARPARSLVTMLTELSRLIFWNDNYKSNLHSHGN
jgi:hypothetical protein